MNDNEKKRRLEAIERELRSIKHELLWLQSNTQAVEGEGGAVRESWSNVWQSIGATTYQARGRYTFSDGTDIEMEG